MSKPPASLAKENKAKAGLSSLLQPFEALAEEKRDLLREVLQIYVSKDSGNKTDSEKRQRLTALINHYAKGEEL